MDQPLKRCTLGKLDLIRQREKEPPSERLLEKIPLLKTWLKRGRID
jgi:hypothetical protein